VPARTSPHLASEKMDRMYCAGHGAVPSLFGNKHLRHSTPPMKKHHRALSAQHTLMHHFEIPCRPHSLFGGMDSLLTLVVSRRRRLTGVSFQRRTGRNKGMCCQRFPEIVFFSRIKSSFVKFRKNTRQYELK